MLKRFSHLEMEEAMVWGKITLDGRTGPEFVERIIAAEAYIDSILHPVVTLFAKILAQLMFNA